MKYQTTLRNIFKQQGYILKLSKRDFISAGRKSGIGNIVAHNFGQWGICIHHSLHRGEGRQEAYSIAKTLAEKIKYAVICNGYSFYVVEATGPKDKIIVDYRKH